MVNGSSIRQYRRSRRVGQVELAAELGHDHASYVSRLERRRVTSLEYAEAVAAVERVVARRDDAATPIDIAVQEAVQLPHPSASATQ